MRTTSFQVRVALADDHQLVCAAITQLLQLDPRIKVVAQAHDGQSAEQLVEQRSFDVLLLDLQMRGKHGLELLKTLGDHPPACVLSAHTESHFIVEAIRAGANGYVSKQAAPEELLHAVLCIARGETYFSTDVRQAALNFTARGIDLRLTAREQDVLRLCAAGLASFEVAAKLNISRRTAEAHRANFMKKLSLRSQTDLVRYALRHGIITQDLSLDRSARLWTNARAVVTST
ncbi:MAG TPA: response regulator transcription factor [Verrucomicrobiae bacterium]